MGGGNRMQESSSSRTVARRLTNRMDSVDVLQQVCLDWAQVAFASPHHFARQTEPPHKLLDNSVVRFGHQ